MKPVTLIFFSRTARQRGFSLVECLMAVAVAAVAAGTALPGFKQVLEQRRLDGAAAQLHTDLQLARSSAVALNRSLRISFDTGTHGSCYVVHTGSAGACRCDTTGLTVCVDDAQALRSVHFTPGSVQLQSNVGSMLLDGAKGTVSPTGTLRLVSDEGRAVHVVVNIMGRLRKCSPGAAVRGYARC